MVIFLTSSPTGPLDGSRKVDGLDKKNHFVDQLRKYWKEHSRCCIIAASPDAYEQNDEMCDFFRETFLKENFSIQCFDLIDRRYSDFTKDELQQYDVILLGGGHVPTQNQFFKDIQLREKIKDFDGIIIGISAGSMNSATLVYAQPELEGEVIDPTYQRFIPGLGLTEKMILPHYSSWKNEVVDGLRLLEDVTYPDSQGYTFYLMEDDSYVLGDTEEKIEEVVGEHYVLRDGVIVQ